MRNSVRSWSRSRKIGAPNDKPRLCLEVLESRTLLDGSLGMLRPLHAPGTPNFDQTPSPSRPREIGPSLHLDGGFNGIGYPGVEGFSVPPDTIGAAGPNHYVEVVNSGIGIYKKGGTVVSTTAESTFFHASSIQNLGDGGVMFDDSVDNGAGKPAGRFIVWALDFSFGDFYFAVSNDADPTHGFTEKHQVDMTQGHFFFPDYPRFGMNADSYVFSFDENSNTALPHVRLLTIDKPSVLDRNPATFTSFQASPFGLGGDHFRMTPAVMHGSTAGDPMYFVDTTFDQALSTGGSRVEVVLATKLLSGFPTFKYTSVQVPAYSVPPSAAQKGGGSMDTDGAWNYSVDWRGDRLVSAQTVGTAGVAHARFYEFNTSLASPTLTQEGEINPGPGVNTYYPSIAIAPDGTLGMTYMESSANEFVSMYVTGQTAKNPPGFMYPGTLAKAGQRNYAAFDGSPYRAGDYSGLTIDPVNHSFWAANEYATSASFDNWGTWITNFDVPPPAGPSVVFSTPGGDLLNAVSSVRVAFDEVLDAATFTSSKITSFTGSGGQFSIPITDVNPVNGSGGTQFDITFAKQTTLGIYTMVLGPDIRDPAGNPMDQDGDGIPGEVPSDGYTLTFVIHGLKVLSSTPSTVLTSDRLPVRSVRVTFNEPVDPTSFTTDQVSAFRAPAVLIDVKAVTPVAGSNNQQFDISFAPQVKTGVYHVLIGPNIKDNNGNAMDQDDNFMPGEVPADSFDASFSIAGLQIASATPNTTTGPVYRLSVSFKAPIDASTFTTDAIASFTGPNGDIPVTQVVIAPSSSDFRQFDLLFPLQTTTGRYTMVIGPGIQDLFGNLMDQNGNFIPGEVPGDQFTARFIVPGPRVVASNALSAGLAVPAVDRVRVTFSTRIDVASFTVGQIVSFTGPAGPIPVTGVAVVPFTNNTQFDISFDAQGADATYTMVIGPDIRDLYGNPMDQDGDGIPGEVPGDQFTIKFNPTVRNIEDFETGGISRYKVIDPFAPTNTTASAEASSLAKHDGNFGLRDFDGNDWIYRTDDAAQVSQGDVISVWIQFAGGTFDGRAYFGFGASDGGTLSVVLAGNSSAMVIQSNRNFSFNTLASVTQRYQTNRWYRLEVNWAVGGGITARLFDSDGSTLLKTVMANFNGITQGGIAFRGFGSFDIYWDDVTALTGAGPGPAPPGGRSSIKKSGGQLGSGPAPGLLSPELAGLLLGRAAVQLTAYSGSLQRDLAAVIGTPVPRWDLLTIDGLFASPFCLAEGTAPILARPKAATLAVAAGEVEPWAEIFGNDSVPSWQLL